MKLLIMLCFCVWIVLIEDLVGYKHDGPDGHDGPDSSERHDKHDKHDRPDIHDRYEGFYFPGARPDQPKDQGESIPLHIAARIGE